MVLGFVFPESIEIFLMYQQFVPNSSIIFVLIVFWMLKIYPGDKDLYNSPQIQSI